MKYEKTTLEVIVSAQEWTDEVFRLLNKEKLFPKRSRWLGAQDLAKECNKLLSLMRYANRLPTDIQTTMEERTLAVWKAVGTASAIAGMINDVVRRFGLDADEFKNSVRLYNMMMPRLVKWAESHNKPTRS